MKLMSIFLILLVILITGATGFADSTCRHRSIGEFRFHDGQLFDSMGTILDVDIEAFRRGDFDQLRMSDLTSGNSFVLKRSMNALPVARNNSFNRIVLRGIDSEDNHFYVLDSRGNVLHSFFLPDHDSNQKLGEYFQVKMSEDGATVLLSSTRKIISYHLKSKTWKTLYEVNPGGDGLGWMNSRTEMVNVIQYGNRLAFRQEVLLDSSSENYSVFVLMAISSGKKLMELKTTSLRSRLIGERYLAFDEGSQFLIWDISDGRIVKIPRSGINDPDSVEFFEGPLNSIGVVSAAQQTISLYGADGRMLKEFPSSINPEAVVVDGARRLFVESSEGAGVSVFDARTGIMTEWPDILAAALNGTLRFFSENKIYLNLYSNLNSMPRFIEIDLATQCLSDKDAKAFVESLLDGTRRGDYILALSALEGKVAGIDRATLAEKMRSRFSDKVKVKTALGMLLYILNLNDSGSDLWHWYLSAMQEGLKKLSESRKEKVLDLIAIRISEKVRLIPEFVNAPTSKIANVIVEIIKPFFGLPAVGKTDFTLLQVNESVMPVIFGSDPIDGETQTRTFFGLYVKFLPPLIVQEGSLTPFNIRWSHRGKKWQAQGEARRLSLGGIINSSESLNYSKLWSDKKLTGVVMLSSNLLDGFDNLAAKMISYYQKEGFNFGIPQLKWKKQQGDWREQLKGFYLFPWNAVPVVDSKEWVREQIISGNVDYLVKEAHSGGNDEVVWLAKKNYVVKGVKKMADGRREEVYLLIPEQIDPLTGGREVPIRDFEFGEWVRQREEKSGTDLVYVNGSCWSNHRAKQEIIAARSPILHVIATQSSAWTFSDKSNNHERVLIDSLRKGKSYPDMKSTLEAIQGTPNPFIFPNEEVYDATIWQGLHSALDFKFDLSETR